MADLSLDTVIRRSESVMHGDLGERAVMMDLESGTYYGVSAVGRRIWSMLDEPIPLAAVVDRLTDEYEVDRAECERQVQAFAADLVALGVAVAEDPGEAP